MHVQRHPLLLRPDSTRVLIRPFFHKEERKNINIIGRILAMSEKAVETELERVFTEFSSRHGELENIFQRHYQKARSFLFTDAPLSQSRELLIGACFTSEYALESAALFNPSIVIHPKQDGVPAGSVRFVLSLRATGEGHISSITFRSGIINEKNEIRLNPIQRYVTNPEICTNANYDKALFQQKLLEMGVDGEGLEQFLHDLPIEFTKEQLNAELNSPAHKTQFLSREERRTKECILWLAQSNYVVSFASNTSLSERIIFPNSANESNGIEDARFVRFRDDNGQITYYATYTAYNGRVILPQFLETKDFLTFSIITLNGPAVQNKGMALFPKKIKGHYAMISRQDNENLYIMFSDNLHFWHEPRILLRPSQPWEYIQIGNCGSPIETEKGWLVLTHGVGPMRKYCIGAILLDRNDPTRVIGRLREPLLKPEENEREGYVPNVVYTCGGLVHNGQLIIPYAMSDSVSSFASVSLNELLSQLKP